MGAGAVLAFCADDAKAGTMLSSTAKISAIASFFIRVGFSFSGIVGQLNFYFAADPPANRTRQRLVSLLARRRSQRTCHSSAPRPPRFSPLFSHARAAPRPLHCGICARRLKTATEEKAKVKRQKAKVRGQGIGAGG